ncbi:MAG: glycosyltransferase [Patescibacteria group bacterium]
MANLSSRVALVYDRVNKWGGAEQVLLALHEMFPEAPLYTAVYNSAAAGWAKVFPGVSTTFLQKFPWAKSSHELYPWLTPLAFETLNFDDYDLVISVTSADAKGIITKPSTFHLCYCLTPTRYLWSHEQFYRKTLDPSVEFISRPVFNYLKSWDKIAAHRPDAYIAISQTVKDRIKKYYGQDSQIIYPPVDVDFFSQPATMNHELITNNFFLYVGRLVAYKQAQLLVEIFNDLQLPLAIIGTGTLENKLKAMAAPNIHFLGHLAQTDLAAYYQRAQAVLYIHEEDFGLVPVEAHSAGTPVIGLNRGGAAETIIHNQTGILLDSDEPGIVKNAILNFDPTQFDREFIKSHAQKFAKDRFKKEFTRTLIRLNSGWRRRNSPLAPISRKLP